MEKAVKKKITKIGWVLESETVATLKACLECKENPAVFLTAKKVPCCRLCWEKLANGLDISAVAVEDPNCQLPDRVSLDVDAFEASE